MSKVTRQAKRAAARAQEKAGVPASPGNGNAPPAPAPDSNVASPQGEPVLVACNACNRDISDSCIATLVPQQQRRPDGTTVHSMRLMLFQPLRCPHPDCRKPLFFFDPTAAQEGGAVAIAQPIDVEAIARRTGLRIAAR